VKLVAVIFFAIGIIFTTLHGGRGAPLPPPEELLSTSTLPLENLSLAPGDFIILADLTPIPIEAAHISMNVPCQVAGNNSTNNNITPSSDIQVIAGVAPDLKPATPEYIAELSHPENNKCTYHVQLPQVADQKMTNIAIMNISNQTIKFSSGNFATISISSGGPLS
jgi:hypothetical protein